MVRETAQTVVYVTHDQPEALTLTDYIVVMNEGRVAQQGPPREIYATPNSEFVGWFLGNSGMNFVAVKPIARDGRRWLESPFLETPVALPQEVRAQTLKIGFRPECVRLSDRTQQAGFTARVSRKSLTIGGQILLLERNGITFKAKVDRRNSVNLRQEGRVEVAREAVLFFDDCGARIPPARLRI